MESEVILKSKKSGVPCCPLSYGQEALWFLYQMAPQSVAYNIFTTVKICSNLDITALHSAWQKIVNRHPILRTTYTSYSGNPVQEIHEQQEIAIEVTDASNWSEDYLKEKILSQTDRPFNLEKDSVLRVNLYTRSAQEHVLLLTMHHIAGDMWSFDLLLNEFQVLYAVETKQASSQQIEVAKEFLTKNISYQEFVSWQSSMLSSLKGEELWKYWQQKLAGELPVLNLPTDRPRPPVQTYRGETHIFKLDEKLIQELKNLTLTSGTSLYRILLAAFFVLLYRYTNTEDIIVGSPMAGRWGKEEFKEIVGYFVNSVVLRASVSGDLAFKDFLAHISSQVKQAQEHQDYPFALLVEQLQQEQDPSRSPLFQVNFTWQKQRWCHPTKNSSHNPGKELQIEPYSLGHRRGASFDLDVMVIEVGEVIQVCWQYNTDLFNVDTIARMAVHFQTLLSAIVTNPELRVSSLPLLSEPEQHQLLVEWNNTKKEYPQDKCIHQLFEEQVKLTPDAVAVKFGSQQLTYNELNKRANQLADYLLSLGVKPEVLVGICVERSLFMVVGILGIIKAGGAYVPFDPTYPSERLAFMLEDTSVPILLTQQQLVQRLPNKQEIKQVCLDADWHTIACYSQANPINQTTPSNLVYTIYTSGSTGLPKGVLIEHKALVSYTLEIAKQFNLQASDKFLQFAAIGFDVVVEEIFPTWLSGATVVLPETTELISCADLLSLMEKEEVTVIELPTVYWHQLVYELSRSRVGVPTSLRLVIIGGEKASLESLTTWQKFGISLIHVYGLTETTVTSTTYHVPSYTENQEVWSQLPIGRPIANTQIYLLDSHQQPVPIGVIGEVYIGGIGLARGYLNRQDLTEGKFIANPFSDQDSARLYKTGDLGRYLPDGNIEFVGRIDHQVKIRGFRIELGEIEAVLNTHPHIREALVIAKEDQSDNKCLVAYLVSDQVISNSDLRHFLKQKLPDYMVPGAFVMLSSLPLTPNGKVDRRALPEPEFRPELELTFVTPRTQIEEILASIWAKVLGIKLVGVHDNFFELGGHSLLATQVISRICDAFVVEIPLRSLFEAPTIATLAKCIQTALTSGQSTLAPPLLPIPRPVQIPLSFAQDRLWFIDQLQPESAFYNIPFALRLSGQLNLVALEQSLNQIICRHENLRTNFTIKQGQPFQIIAATLNLKLVVVDLENLSACKQEIETQQLVTQLAVQHFDLEREPLLRANVLKLGLTEHVFVLVLHHIIVDGWSLGVLERELATCYEAFCSGLTPALPKLPIQYADFALWQRNALKGEVLQTQLDYWQQQLKGIPTLLELPTDRPRPATQTYKGAHLSIPLSFKLSQELASLRKHMGVTLFMTLLAAFQVLLYRYTNSDDIVIGTPIANRNRQEIEGLIGFFVNTLVLRTDLSGNPSFEQLLGRVREVTLGAYAHQDLPFEELVEALQPERSLSHSPLFQVMFTFENTQKSCLDLHGLMVSSLPVETPTAKFDLTLSMQDTANGLIGVWEYNTDLFDADTIARMALHLQTILEAIVANPKAQISKLPLLTEVERQQLLVEWNNTQTQYPQDKCIHQLFEAQVQLTPNAVAVVFEDKQLTYRELNAKANQLAHYLQALDVKPEVLVGICVQRSLEMVVGLLGILKAGGAYVPLDPTYPSERLAFMLEDASVAVLLTEATLVEKFPQHSQHIFCLDFDWGEISQYSSENLVSRVMPDNLAYIIYTSGSTGKPKGVLVAHNSVCNLVTAQKQLFDVQPNSSVLQFASFSFDASVWEIFMALASGATLVLATQDSLMPGSSLIGLLRDKAITTVTLPPSVLAVLPSEEFPALQTIIVAGEACSSNLVARWAPGRQFFNAYGPTESTVCTTVALCSSGSQKPPIGRPIANTQVYVLNEKLQPVPVGVLGELYIGGDGLAHGYLNRPDLTAEKFIPNPFSKKLGERLYKTGDLVRYLPDGNIEFFGRIDNQVKIRGFRIELGEIETVISQHPLVKETVVIAAEKNIGNKQLVAYIVPHKELAPTIGDLRGFLKEQLPDYMMPSVFVILDALPLTPNRKVDRRALPAPEYQLELELGFVAPRTPVEEILANIWAEVLVLKEVGIYNNFFELGGHSLLAVQIISRICEKFEIDLPLSCLFQSPTIAALSQLIDSTLTTNTQGYSSGNIPAVSPQARSQVIPLSFAQDYIWCSEHKLAGKCAANSPMALRLTGTLSRTVLEQSLNEIICRHEILRTTFPIVEEQPTQKIAPSFTLPFQFIDLQYLCSQMSKEAEAHRIFREAMNHEFDLTVAPPIKTILIQLSEEEHWLLIAMHHIITDGWSCGILLQELETIYSNFLLGKPSPLPELPLQYADFAIWQRKYFSEEVLLAHLPYWQQQLANFPACLDIFPAIQSTPDKPFANEHNFSLPVSLTSNIASLSHAYSVTPFIVLLTALNILLHKWSKQTDILVVGTIANRSTPEIERLLGCFISDLPLGIQLNCNQTAISLLEQVRKTVVEGLTYAIPSEKICEPVQNKFEILRTVTFVLVPATNWLGQTLKCEELTISSDRGLWSEQDVPLELYAYYPNETTQAIKFHACYSTTTFTAEMIERFLKSYEVIIEQLVRYPETIISNFVLIE